MIYRLAACCLACTQTGAFGLPKQKLTAACAHAEIETETEREERGGGRRSRNKNLCKVQIILH